MSDDLITIPIAVPRSSMTIIEAPPDFVSQRNSLKVIATEPRPFLAMLRRPDCPLAITRIGKLRLVPREDLVRWLRSLASPARDVDGVDDVLASVGLQEVAR